VEMSSPVPRGPDFSLNPVVGLSVQKEVGSPREELDNPVVAF